MQFGERIRVIIINGLDIILIVELARPKYLLVLRGWRPCSMGNSKMVRFNEGHDADKSSRNKFNQRCYLGERGENLYSIAGSQTIGLYSHHIAGLSRLIVFAPVKRG